MENNLYFFCKEYLICSLGAFIFQSKGRGGNRGESRDICAWCEEENMRSCVEEASEGGKGKEP